MFPCMQCPGKCSPYQDYLFTVFVYDVFVHSLEDLVTFERASAGSSLNILDTPNSQIPAMFYATFKMPTHTAEHWRPNMIPNQLS